MITEIAFTCYPVTDMKRARAFYEGVLGLVPDHRPDGDSEFWVEYTVGNGTFALGKMDGFVPHTDGACLGFEVDDFPATVARLEAAGIPFLIKAMETSVCFMASVKDPEGNDVMVHKRK